MSAGDRERADHFTPAHPQTIDLAKLKEFVTPRYDEKDELHGLRHVERLLAGARELAQGHEVDDDLLVLGAHFHGCIHRDEPAIRKFLASSGLRAHRIDRVITVARESGRGSRPGTKEGGYLHDAHLIEGGRAFGVAKCLITGALRGQTLEEKLDFVESNLLGKFACVTTKAQVIFAECERFTFVSELRRALRTEGQTGRC